MEPPVIAALIAGIAALVAVVIRRWLELSATRPKAAVTFLSRVKIGYSALTGELGISATRADLAAFKEHLWFWQAAKLSRMYDAILRDQQQSESYRQKVKALHAYVSRLT